MKSILAVALIAILATWVFRALRREPAEPIAKQPIREATADTGRGLREMILTTSPEAAGEVPSDEFPRVYGLLMDWVTDESVATVFSSSRGAASLYTTSTFGVIGGERDDAARAAAIAFVRAADQHFTNSRPTSDFGYPEAGFVRFYLLTFEGVRLIEADEASIDDANSEFTELYRLGQAVLTELLRISRAD